MSTVLVAHPSPDLYGSDLQLVETVRALLACGHEVKVALPSDGPLSPALRSTGARVAVLPFTVLRKALLTPRGLASLAGHAAAETARLCRLVRTSRADLLLTNTVTIPWWPPAGRLAGVPVLAHVHEAEDTQHRLVRSGLNAPLVAADRVVVNSAAARQALLSVLPGLAPRTTVVHNGVAAPDRTLAPLRRREVGSAFRVAMVGRLSPRKGVDVALEAVALLRRRGVDASLTVCGSTFPGYEWYEEELRGRASQPDLAGHVTLLGYVHPTWPVLESADAVVVPSRAEPFGNTAVEAMHAGRPLVASRVQGLAEVVTDQATGILVPPDDPAALADGLETVATHPDTASVLAQNAVDDAAARFSVTGYRTAMARIVSDLLSRR